MVIQISDKKLQELMIACYEAGWYGVLELKGEFVDDLLNTSGLLAKTPEVSPPAFTIETALDSLDSSATISPSFIMSSGPASIQQTFGFASTAG